MEAAIFPAQLLPVGCEVDMGVAAWTSAGNSAGLSGRSCQFHSFY